MTGLPLIFAFWLAIVIMIVMISKLRIHPFISIMLVSLGLGLAAGIPPPSSDRAFRGPSQASASSLSLVR